MNFPRFERVVRSFAIDTSGAIVVVMIAIMGLKGNLTLQYIIAGIGIFIFYFLPYLISSGQSFGKRIEGIRIVNKDGSPIHIIKSLLRQIVLLGLSFLTVGIYLVVIFFSINEKNGQSLHDKMFGTAIIDLRAPLPKDNDDFLNKTDSMRKKGL
ncbi:MAG: RDD family protein [Acholeplasmataceae bacterium]|jgi:uncharacterized RDD family membrane protein YckC